VKIKENFNYLVEEDKPLLPQLRKIKRACFAPYLSDLQLIKHKCEECSEEGTYSKCDFYETTHLSCFTKTLEEIQKNDSIHKPKIFHPKAERLCFGRISLEKILKGAWPLMQHEAVEPAWYGTDEHRAWNTQKKELQKNLPCESTCKMQEWCSFYQNDFERKLCVTTIKDSDAEEVYWNTNFSTKTDKGYRIDSWLYKEFIIPTVVKELPPIKTDLGFKKLDEWQYKVYERVYKAVSGKSKQSVVELKGVLEILATEKEERVFLEKLEVNKVFDYKKVRQLVQQHKGEFSETAAQLIEINLTFWREWVKQQHLEFTDVLYAWHLSQVQNPSRKELEDKFGISQRTQIVLEKRLGVRKDFRGVQGSKQYTNTYLVNPYVLGAIFRTLNKEERKNKLTEIGKINKEKLKRKKLYNRKNQPKLSTKQLEQLEQLHKQIKTTNYTD